MNQTSTRPSYRTDFVPAEGTTWYIVDASGKSAGRLASRIAALLLGKNSPNYSPQWDGGQRVIVINAAKVKLTGRKMSQKVYYSHSGYPGGLKETLAEDMMARKPGEILRLAVKGMLPKNALGRKLLKNLRIYADDVHEHEAQKPVKVEV